MAAAVREKLRDFVTLEMGMLRGRVLQLRREDLKRLRLAELSMTGVGGVEDIPLQTERQCDREGGAFEQ